MSVPLIKTLIVGLLPLCNKGEGVTVLLSALWKMKEKLLFVLLCSQCWKKKNRGRGFAPFCFSETVNLRVVISYNNRFGQLCI